MPRRLPVLVTFALFLAISGRGLAAQGTWAPVTGGGMTVTIPCTAASWTQDDRDGIVTNQYLCRAADEMFLLAWTDARTDRPNAKVEMEANRDALVKTTNSTLLTTGDVTYQGIAGIEFTANWQSRASMITCRTLMVGKRLYSIVVVTPLNQDRSATISRFLASLRIAR
jgi:hypothetical protein